MAKVVNIASSMDAEMKKYQEKILKHRIRVIIKGVVIAVAVILCIIGFRFYLNNRSFTGYSIASTIERNDTMTTKYEMFGENILKYGRDGISYTDRGNSLLFSITYTMQEPILALSQKSGVVADKNGNQIYVFDQSKQTGQITTLLPIKHVAVSNQGVVAVLLEDTKKSRLEVYSSEGECLGAGEFTLDDSGYPMNLTISSDGTKFAIAFAKVEGTKFNSCIGIYNFGSVGGNYVDRLVFSKSYADYMIPEVHYFDEDTLVSVGDGLLTFYQGTQIPEVLKEITFEEEIKSIHYSETTVGLVFRLKDGMVLRTYDMKGNLVAEVPFDMNYDNICIMDKGVLLYSSTEMALYSYSGKECFRQTFETPVVDIFPTNFRSKYLFIYTNETQLIKLQ